MATDRKLRLGLVLGVLLSAASTSAGQEPVPSADDPTLLESIASQAPAVSDAEQLRQAVSLAQARQVWIEQDSILCSWPRYLDVREELRQELSLKINIANSTVTKLRGEAVWLRYRFWYEGGPLAADGYRRVYMSRILLEAAHEREPADLNVSDELVETIQAAHPLSCYDAEVKDWLVSREVFLDLRALRSENYDQVKSEVEQGRAFAFADFARVADYVVLWSACDPAKAAEAFEWALSQVGPSLQGSDYEGYAAKVLQGIRKGGGVAFAVYLKLNAKYPHDYLYVRRLPSFQGPDPEGRWLTPMLGIGKPVQVSFGS